MNLAAESMLGCSIRVARYQLISQLFPLPKALFSQIEEVLTTGQMLMGRKIEIQKKSQESIYVDCMITPMEQAGDKARVLLELMDIDRQHKIETERALLEQQERSQNILRGVAHEVLNPLGGIRGAAQLLEQELADSRLTDYTQLLIKEADRLQKLLQQMLGPNTRPVLKPNNIHEILDYVIRLLLHDNPASIKTILDYDPSIPDIVCDREKLIQVFVNLVSNALHATRNTPDPRVTLKTRVERNFTIRGKMKKLVCKILVIDNGTGITPSLANTLFDPLVSGRQGGIGLGLSIAQSQVAQHGGLIECRSVRGNTVFEVTLPIEDRINES